MLVTLFYGRTHTVLNAPPSVGVSIVCYIHIVFKHDSTQACFTCVHNNASCTVVRDALVACGLLPPPRRLAIIFLPLLLISAPSLGVYYCQQLTLSLSVRMSVCHTPSNCFFFFVSRWNRAIFWPSVLHVALYKTLFFDFLI